MNFNLRFNPHKTNFKPKTKNYDTCRLLKM